MTLTLRDRGNPKDPNAVIAEAKPRLIDTKNLGNNFRALVDIYDSSGARIGTIRQTWESLGGSILQNLALGGSIWTTYEILDANEQVIARSAKTEFFGAKMEVTDNGRLLSRVQHASSTSWCATTGRTSAATTPGSTVASSPS